MLTAPQPVASPVRLARFVTGYAAAVVLVPAMGLPDHPSGAQVGAVAVAVVVAVLAMGTVARLVTRPRLALVGLGLVGTAALVAGVVPAGSISVVIGLLAGAGVGLLAPEVPSVALLRSGGGVGLTVGVVQAGVARLVLGGDLGLIALVLQAAAVTGWSLGSAARPRPRVDRTGRLVTGGAVAVALVLVAWVGGNDPAGGWFGSVITHGPRTSNQVALTFDDGPNQTYTLQVRDLLDRYGVKGTFFTVGKALVQRPDLTKALVDDGHLVGNHSYFHSYWGWLNPRYPELDRTQEAFKAQLGVCPAFYRPPHGQRTPFISALVDHRGMSMVTWDVSAGDWATTDARLVADRVLAGVHPGSIILLHDALDGNLVADRSVVVAALPMILDGLKAKGLTPVRLDVLLGRPGYLPSC